MLRIYIGFRKGILIKLVGNCEVVRTALKKIYEEETRRYIQLEIRTK